jgi:predicted MFS family arabinose efflux permease
MENSITLLWRNRNFVRLWIGQTVSQLGSRITREGLPFTAIKVLNAKPEQMGLLYGVSGAVVLLFGLSAGVWGDRLKRRPILIVTDLGRAALLCLVPLAAFWHVLSMSQLYAIGALTSVLTVFFDVAYQSYLPSLVSGEQLVEGNAQLMLSSTVAEIAGPSLTGVLVQLITAPIAILLDALSFVFSALMVWGIRAPEEKPEPPRSGSESVWKETTAGLQFMAGNPILRSLALRDMTAYFFFGFLGSLYVLYAIDYLKMTPAQLGVTIAVGGVGGVIGSALSTRIVRRLGLGPTFVVTGLIHGLMAMLIPAAHPPASFAIAMLMTGQLFGDSAFAVYSINELSVRQTAAPAAVLGRVNAAMQLATRGIYPIGALLGGYLAGTFGVRFVLAVAAVGIILSTLWLVNQPLLSLKADMLAKESP